MNGCDMNYDGLVAWNVAWHMIRTFGKEKAPKHLCQYIGMRNMEISKKAFKLDCRWMVMK
jgi:hypothetical protein